MRFKFLNSFSAHTFTSRAGFRFGCRRPLWRRNRWSPKCRPHRRSDLEANKQIAAEFIAALSSGDAQRILDLYTDDATVWTSGSLPFSTELILPRGSRTVPDVERTRTQGWSGAERGAS